MWNFQPVAGIPDTYTAVNRQSGKCLDVNGLSTADGAAVQQWTCNGGANQRFTLRKVTSSGSDSHDYQLVARHSGKCVDVSGISTAPRALIHQWPCNPADRTGPANQTWRLLGR
ncbi:RICIN domain-containing protein [Actinomadura sediminis]|uniref:RICIN domain-containing protein n=1 Tax=Actinomadura sediminis TaxID=1038904 RepID=A0ABW3EG31_9ACTN